MLLTYSSPTQSFRLTRRVAVTVRRTAARAVEGDGGRAGLEVGADDRHERPDRSARGSDGGDRGPEAHGEAARGRRRVLVPGEVQRLHLEGVAPFDQARQRGRGRRAEGGPARPLLL